MITCKECGASFAKPATRGRPPVRCESCRAGNGPAAASKAKPERVVPESLDTILDEKPVSRKYTRSGFCNIRHDGSIHKLCSGLSGHCKCACHSQ